MDDNGFSERELEDIGRFLREMLDRGVWDQEDLDQLVEITRRSEFQRGWITIEQLDAIALDVTEYYRENGFILATAFIPAQEVTDNVIRFNVLEGRLGNVTVSNNEVYSPETISAVFAKDIGAAVTEERIESALRRINDLPGIRVRGSFSPGEEVGETSLNLGVLQEQAWSSSVVFDNHGAEATGVHRLFASAEWLNVADKGHRLTVGALRSEGPDSSIYGLVDYTMPITRDKRGEVRFGISSNEFEVSGLESLPNVTGETNNFGLTGSYQFVRSRTFNLSAEAGYTQKDVLFDVEGAPLLSRDERLEVVNATVDYNQLWDEQQLLLSARLGIDQGHIMSGALRGQSSDFTKVLFGANLLKRFSLDNWLTKNESFFNFVVRLNGQYAEHALSSVEQFSLGGPSGVRAFSVSDVSVDSAAYAGFELFFDAPVDLVSKFELPLEPIKPFVFFDYAYGVARTIGAPVNRDAILKAYGIGFRLN
ncbi:MAG: ShlB/FhaC/HecB family hemolysin secretion/activation protein, partial [Pseudomonadales bacterium]